MSPSAIATPPEASALASQLKLGELSSKGMHRDLVPECEQSPVPAADDPVRFTQKATTAHMVKVRWTAENGWENAEMVPYGKISLEPTASVLHYATETFVSEISSLVECLKLTDTGHRKE
jgi:branched-chain amino acid aminotransferase